MPLALLVMACSDGPLGEPEQRIERIRVATYNVDGLPIVVPLGTYGDFIKQLLPEAPIELDDDNNLIVNADGPGEKGSRMIGENIREKDWDVFGLNEDFNYHEEIWNSLAEYTSGTFLGRFEGELSDVLRRVLARKTVAETDGLQIGVRKPYDVSGELIRPWNPDALNGYLTHSQDSLARKGFRYYQVSFDRNTTIDFIVLHADAGTSRGDILAREAAFGQLYSFITEEIRSDNPLIVMGDFNSMYERDRLKSLFIDRLNIEAGLEASDVWVEKMNGGAFPEYDPSNYTGSVVTESSEMLDKIIYVNRRNAPFRLRLESADNVFGFEHEDGRDLSDHHPIEAVFVIAAD